MIFWKLLMNKGVIYNDNVFIMILNFGIKNCALSIKKYFA